MIDNHEAVLLYFDTRPDTTIFFVDNLSIPEVLSFFDRSISLQVQPGFIARLYPCFNGLPADLFDTAVESIETVDDFLHFYRQHEAYSIDVFEARIDDRITPSSDDDYAHNIMYSRSEDALPFVQFTLDRLGMSKEILEALTVNLGKYLAIDKASSRIEVFHTFDDYLRSQNSRSITKSTN